MKMSFNYDANKTHFHNKGFALSLVLKVRFFGTRKWRILAIVSLRTKLELLTIFEQYYISEIGKARFLLQ